MEFASSFGYVRCSMKRPSLGATFSVHVLLMNKWCSSSNESCSLLDMSLLALERATSVGYQFGFG